VNELAMDFGSGSGSRVIGVKFELGKAERGVSG
jgi:hypothetical protein